jgi:hypothetical protein
MAKAKLPVKQRDFFSKVRIARELLKEKSEEILKEYLDVVQKAKDAGDYETAAKSLQWLIEHMPADEEGGRLVEQSVDKKQEVVQTGPTGPAIQIGIQVGGVGQKQLPKPSELPAITTEIIDSER